jgi:hypothetical protein
MGLTAPAFRANLLCGMPTESTLSPLARPAARLLALAGLLRLLPACGSNPSTPQNYTPGPNYSSTSCFDNCGSDSACQANCTNSTAPAFPGTGAPGVAPGPYTPH